MSTQARRFDPKKRLGLVSTERQTKWEPPRFLARLDLRPGQTVLDLGCGPGFWTLPLAELVGPAGTVWALDVSQEMLDALAARRPPPQVCLLRCELPVITVSDASVDWIWAAFVFHEVERPEKLAAEMRRVTRIGGRVAILDWRPDAESDHLRAVGFQDVVQTWQNEDACLIQASRGRTIVDAQTGACSSSALEVAMAYERNHNSGRDALALRA